MGLLSCEQMRALEEEAFRRGGSAEELMNKAGRRLGEAVGRLCPGPGTAVAYLGRGNNGGDALVALQVLRARGWRIEIRAAHRGADLGELPQRKLAELGDVTLRSEPLATVDLPRPLLLLDGLVGIGARGPLRPPLDELAAEMNRLRREEGATTVAVDLPSGLDGNSGDPHPGAVRADLTATIGVPKTGLVADAAIDHVGRLEVIPLDELPAPAEGDRLITAAELRPLFPPRPFQLHKGGAGRVGIVAGSPGMWGASLLTALGALRGGGGLVTLYVWEDDYPLALAAGPPAELMVKPVPALDILLDDQLDSLAIGPGLGSPGQEKREAILELLSSFGAPMVVDADALNLLAAEGRLDLLDSRMVVTPHPGEMARLFPPSPSESLTRAETARDFVGRHPCALLYKGARTIVTAPGEPLYYNSTGTPGMATGGEGDVLTGLLAALLAGGHPAIHAARAAAWLAGRASELAIATGSESEESLTAGDTARFLGAAFSELRGRC